jgi:hypothetical protein
LRGYMQSLPGVVQSQLKRRQAMNIKVASWGFLEMLLTWIMAVSAIGALVSLVSGLVLVFVERSSSPVLVILTLVSGAFAFGFWKLMQRVVRHKNFLRSQVD